MITDKFNPADNPFIPKLDERSTRPISKLGAGIVALIAVTGFGLGAKAAFENMSKVSATIPTEEEYNKNPDGYHLRAVKPGETLSGIASEYTDRKHPTADNTAVLLEQNGGSPVIHPGDTFEVPKTTVPEEYR